MAFQTKRVLREKIAALNEQIAEYEAEREESTASARNAIRVLNLTPYIKEITGPWGPEIDYDVNQFLADIETGVKVLNGRQASQREAEATQRLGLDSRLLEAEKKGEFIA